MLTRLRLRDGCKFISSQLGVISRSQTVQAKQNELSQNAETAETDPLKSEDFFGVRNMVTLKELFDAGVHVGHKNGTRNPLMKPYIFGNRLGVDIIDLEQTVPMFQDALNFTAHIAYRGGVIMFISRHIRTLPLVEKTAELSGEYAHCRRWSGGTFTNSPIQFGAVTRLPDLVIFTNTLNNMFEQHAAIIETAKMNIPSIGIVDSSCNPSLISYPIPGNDDSLPAIELYCRLFGEAINKGKLKRAELKNSSDDL